MKYNFDNQMIIHYGKSIYTKTYKRVINKTDNNRYNVITYYKTDDGNKVFKLQPKDLASAVSGRSLNNAFGM